MTNIENIMNNIQNNDTDLLQFLSFKVGNEVYGVDIHSIIEIKGWSNTLSIPKTPEYMMGVFNLRGSIIPIFALRAKFEMGNTNPDKTNVVIILSCNNKTIGILVDVVLDIITVNAHELSSYFEYSNISEKFIDGFINRDNELMIILLMIESLFTNRDIDQAREVIEDQ